MLTVLGQLSAGAVTLHIPGPEGLDLDPGWLTASRQQTSQQLHINHINYVTMFCGWHNRPLCFGMMMKYEKGSEHKYIQDTVPALVSWSCLGALGDGAGAVQIILKDSSKHCHVFCNQLFLTCLLLFHEKYMNKRVPMDQETIPKSEGIWKTLFRWGVFCICN